MKVKGFFFFVACGLVAGCKLQKAATSGQAESTNLEKFVTEINLSIQNQDYDQFLNLVEKSVVVYQLPISDFEISPEKIDIVHNQISVISTAQGATDFEYYISDGASFSSPDFEYSLLDTGYFTITQKVTNSFGCTDISEKRVYVNYLINIFIPNAFHPNNDGKNEYFEPQGMGISTYELQIFNRWGEQIFYSEKGEAWDGKNAPTGAYFYVLRLTDFRGVPHNYSGIIHLIR